MKRVGGQWLEKQVDGDKFVCFDSILSKQSCIVYSFGVSNDWSFEDQMDDLGMLRVVLLEAEDPVFRMSSVLLRSHHRGSSKAREEHKFL